MMDRYLLVLAVGAAGVLLIVGCALAWHENEGEWVQRSGSAITAAEALIVVVESRRRHRIERIPFARKESNPHMRVEIERAEGEALGAAILLAVTGELLHGFGDLAFNAIRDIWHLYAG
jgi:hypothetical protein